jgi:hypothetical protein
MPGDRYLPAKSQTRRRLICKRYRFTHAFNEAACDIFQQIVANRMTERIVDIFEMIEI